MISSYLDWWADAGLTDGVSDSPTDWLQAPAAPPPPSTARTQPPLNDAGVPGPMGKTAAASPTPAPAPVARNPLPDDLAGFDAWLQSGPALPGSHWSPSAVMPQGPVGAPLMILADTPDPEDFAAGHLFAGAAGRLLDAMLAAIGLSRDALRVASIAFTRPPGGRIEGPESAELLAIARHHLDIARPKQILLMGQQTCSLLTGDVVPPDGQGQRHVNQLGGMRAVTAIHHPRLLLRQPLLKRPTWTALKRLKEQTLT